MQVTQQDKGKATDPRSPLSEPNTLYAVNHISIKESGTSEILKNHNRCSGLHTNVCAQSLTLAVFCDYALSIVRQGMLHDQFVSTVTEIQHPGKMRNWTWVS